MLKEDTLFGLDDKVKSAIDILKNYEPEEGYYLAFSGGKDSVCIYALAKMAGVKFDAHYNDTTIDPPELRPFIVKNYPDVEIKKEGSFFQLLVKKGYPLRQARWCCSELKEKGGEGRFLITGVRAAESSRRAKRKQVEHCFGDKKKHLGLKKYVHPIFYWSEDEVWEFIKHYNIPYSKLYDEGYKRIGCLFCPLSDVKNRIRDMERYPKYKKAFILAFQKLYDRKKADGKSPTLTRWKNGEEMFMDWILSKDYSTNSDDPELGMVFEDDYQKDE